ncbi:MAG: flagellar biosynthesis anti-sigma factor FlgM [Gammaproteobacteria bacterium]|nr:flagellar biosynthesis anti-sigma factor FlgM [Gammaproteobacteria bacterium]MDH3374622.1 flagellar biosynthesis anti-sigma factor FlgM [Gammaproteobacteria bacterium]MDH3552887.1 flagellar biosynthesis anti-sigma factor FlgM [Gammaproteobacteria bacterium]
MASRNGPLDQGLNGKASNRFDAVSDIGAIVRESGPASTNENPEPVFSAEMLERLEKSLSSLPSVDSIRVAEVKAAIENGDYESDADAIAEAMIRFERSLRE